MTIGPRYTVKFTNGYWKLFDRVTFSDVALFETKKSADEALLKKGQK